MQGIDSQKQREMGGWRGLQADVSAYGQKQPVQHSQQ